MKVTNKKRIGRSSTKVESDYPPKLQIKYWRDLFYEKKVSMLYLKIIICIE